MTDHADDLNQQARAWKTTVLAMSAEDHLERAATHLANADMCRTAMGEEEEKPQPSAVLIDRLRSSEFAFLHRAQVHANLASARHNHHTGAVSGIPAQTRYPQPFLA